MSSIIHDKHGITMNGVFKPFRLIVADDLTEEDRQADTIEITGPQYIENALSTMPWVTKIHLNLGFGTFLYPIDLRELYLTELVIKSFHRNTILVDLEKLQSLVLILPDYAVLGLNPEDDVLIMPEQVVMIDTEPDSRFDFTNTKYLWLTRVDYEDLLNNIVAPDLTYVYIYSPDDRVELDLPIKILAIEFHDEDDDPRYIDMSMPFEELIIIPGALASTICLGKALPKIVRVVDSEDYMAVGIKFSQSVSITGLFRDGGFVDGPYGEVSEFLPSDKSIMLHSGDIMLINPQTSQEINDRQGQYLIYLETGIDTDGGIGLPLGQLSLAESTHLSNIYNPVELFMGEEKSMLHQDIHVPLYYFFDVADGPWSLSKVISWIPDWHHSAEYQPPQERRLPYKALRDIRLANSAERDILAKAAYYLMFDGMDAINEEIHTF